MAGGYAGDLKFNTKIDRNGWNKGTKSIEGSANGLMSTFKKRP
jgi:hypothetical protein